VFDLNNTILVLYLVNDLNEGVSNVENVISLFSNATKFNDQGYGPADFEIDQAPLVYFDSEGKLSESSKHVIFRTDTGEELGVHGSRYSDLYELSYKRMIDNQRNTIARSSLNTSGMQENIQVSYNGAMCFVRHSLPDEKIITPDGDSVSLDLLTVSSLNGVWPFICSLGGHQSACMNKQIFISNAANVYKARHTKKLDIDHGASLISKSVEVFAKEVNMWHDWANIKLNDLQAFCMFAKAANATVVFKWLAEYPNSTVSEMLLQSKIYKNTALIYMWNRWTEHYRSVLGSNQWSVYNVMTDWSTHAPAARESSQVNIASISYKRGENVRQTVINSFKEAA
jgi:hypothetical protein